MPLRVAATTSFLVFAVCLLAGADNTFGTAVGRALVAMMATLGIGLIIGWMMQKMIEENVNQHRAKAVPDASEALAESTTAPVRKTDAKASDNRGAKSAVKKDAAKSSKPGR